MTTRGRALRAVDVLVAGGALLVLTPFLGVVALAVRASSRGPVLFRQTRIGLGGRPFTLLKFRSMTVTPGGPCITPAGDRRVTRVGAWLRRTKVDELPQLLNVLRGDMSLIGPRPEVPEYLAGLGVTGAAYAAVRPGLADAATLAFYDEAARLAAAREPERYYLETILPAKARLSVDYAATRTWRSDLRLVLALGRRIVAGALLLVLLVAAGPAHGMGPLLVVAPHPDDEVLAAGGIIATAVAAGRDVRVVVVTNGDFWGVEHGLTRERESVEALAVIGVPENRVAFLGYPDATLLALWNEAPLASQRFLAPHTGRRTTYAASGFGGADFHSVLTGAPGDYNAPTLVADLRMALDRFRPTEVFVTGPVDEHPDHRATYYALREAVRQLAAADGGFRPMLHTTIVHDPVSYPFDDFWRPGTASTPAYDVSDGRWPNPTAASGVPLRFDPGAPYDMPPSLPQTLLDWSARIHWPVPAAMRVTDFDANLKIQSLRSYRTQTGDGLWARVKADEFSWAEALPIGRYRTSIEGAASASASSAAAGVDGVNDGIVDGAPVTPAAEWTAGEGGPAWVRLRWRAPVRIDRVRLYDRPSRDDRVLAGRLVLDDATVIRVGALANDGRGDEVVLPEPRRVATLTFRIDGAAGVPGLAELEVFGEPPEGACTADDACDDGNPCTADACRAGRCVRAAAPDGTRCGDVDECNGVELCAAGACERNAPPPCDDGDPCTRDTCVAHGSCAHEPTCAPVPARGPARCRVGFVGVPATPCTDGDPACDRDGRVDGGCRFDVVLCVNAGPPAPGCPLGDMMVRLAVGRAAVAGVGELGEAVAPRLPTAATTCVGPVPVRVALRGGGRAARLRMPVRVTVGDGHRLRGHMVAGCRASRQPATRSLALPG